MDEVALEERFPNRQEVPLFSNHSNRKTNLSPELPWCILCNNDAEYQCLDCGDLYCSNCNKEVHKEWDEMEHKVITYKPKS